MKEIFHHYFLSMTRPFWLHEQLKLNRDNTAKIISFDFVEVLSISWLMMVIKGIYSVIALLIGLEWMAGTTGEGQSFALDLWSKQTQKITLYVIILEVILFPMTLYFYAKFWAVILKFFCVLFNREEQNTEQITSEIINHSLVSNFFLIIPIFGGLIRHIAGLFYLFAGLRRNLGFNVLQSLMVLTAPLILLLFILFLTLLYIVLIISMI